jgi:hypothetical protein
MRNTLRCAALLVAVAAAPTSPAFAGPTAAVSAVSAESAAGGGSSCVSSNAYARMSVGQRLSYVRAVAGDEAQTSMRRWGSGASAYQERLYAMCTPRAGHGTLTTRFMRYNGAWRAFLVDTHVGPED